MSSGRYPAARTDRRIVMEDVGSARSPGDTTCPGCGLVLPAETAASPPPALRSSAECWHLYGEVTASAWTDPKVGRLHQLIVDTYAAQHSGPETAAITTAFALVGLYLALELDTPGPQVRSAHQRLAGARKSWPAFTPPSQPSPVTILEVAIADSPESRTAAVLRWAQSVWTSWASHRSTVAELLRGEGLLPKTID